MFAHFLAKVGRTSACAMCAYPTHDRLCARCMKEDAKSYTCVVCAKECSFDVTEHIRLPCGCVVDPSCAPLVDLIGHCPGPCLRETTDPTKIGCLQEDLMALILIAHKGGPPLTREDLSDLEDEKMYWVLSCLYASGIGVPIDFKEEKRWFKEAIYHGDPDAQYSMANLKDDISWLRRAADAGQMKAALAMAHFYMGKRVLGNNGTKNTERATHYVSIGKDPVCVCLNALDAVDKRRPDAETKLRLARRNFSSLYERVTVELASLYYTRGDLVEALLLAASLPDPTAETYVSLGVTLARLSYTGSTRDAMDCFVKADSADAYVCMAKLMEQKVVPGGPEGVKSMMEVASEHGHPEAGFYFLMDPNCANVAKYVDMLRNAKDKPFLIRCAIYFTQNGMTELAEECKRIRQLI